MQKNRSLITIALIWLIVTLLTVITFFLLDIDRSLSLFKCALGFLLAAELLFCLGLLILRRVTSVFARSGLTVVLTLYLVITLILSLCAGNFESVNTFILLEIAVIAVFAILSVLFFHFTGRITASDNAIAGSRAFMLDCERRVLDLANDAKNAAYADSLRKLHESFKYSDNVGGSSADGDISRQVAALEDALRGTSDEGSVNSIIADITALIGRRTNELKASKRGGF